MAKHTLAGHIYWRKTKYMDAPAIRFDMYDMRKWSEESRDGHVHIAEHSIEVEVPDDFDPRPQLVAHLTAEKQKVRAEFAARITELDTQINNLLALEMA